MAVRPDTVVQWAAITSEEDSRQADSVPNHDNPTAILPLEPSSGRGRRHGTSGTAPFDRWFRYPAGFASDYAATLLEHLNLSRRGIIVDPFAGSAVTGTAAQRLGLSFYGIEAHPLIAELGQLKLQVPPAEGRDLIRVGDALIGKLNSSGTPSLDNETELVRQCFTVETLRQLVSLRQLIRSGEAGEWTRHLKWALLATLRDVASARVGWPYQRPGSQRQPQYKDAVSRIRQRIRLMAGDLDLIHGSNSLNMSDDGYLSQVVQGDAQDASSWSQLAAGSAIGCVSSPPYLNNFDYADATRLELYFWGDVTSWAQMCREVRSDMLTATTQQSSVSAAEAASLQLQHYEPIAEKIGALTTQLRQERISRKRGKEYDRVIPAYFTAISRVLSNLAVSLATKAPVVLLVGDSAPYGVYIDTPALIADLSQHLGFVAEKDVILRRRGLRWASNSQRHGVELSERLVLLRRH
ncbi:DNA methyltransferase [Nonomuraea dietziae]|uniref:DNA methyltransferase n=1 Tax=Nonomuraea dietziae TaxID=65515 RepID=UPI0034294856